jgi:hypothetical protein
MENVVISTSILFSMMRSVHALMIGDAFPLLVATSPHSCRIEPMVIESNANKDRNILLSSALEGS